MREHLGAFDLIVDATKKRRPLMGRVYMDAQKAPGRKLAALAKHGNGIAVAPASLHAAWFAEHVLGQAHGVAILPAVKIGSKRLGGRLLIAYGKKNVQALRDQGLVVLDVLRPAKKRKQRGRAVMPGQIDIEAYIAAGMRA